MPKKHAGIKIHNGYVAIFKFHVDLTFEWVEKVRQVTRVVLPAKIIKI